jgi:hypothetical protein
MSKGILDPPYQPTMFFLNRRAFGNVPRVRSAISFGVLLGRFARSSGSGSSARHATTRAPNASQSRVAMRGRCFGRLSDGSSLS